MAEATENTLPAVGQLLDTVSEVGMKFDSFEDVEQFIHDYEESNFVKYYKYDSRTITAARKRLPRRRMEDRLRYHSITFCCVHHGNFKSTSQGARPKQTTLRMGCPSKIRFTVSQDGKQLAIVEMVSEHTHPINEDSFRALPQKRRLSNKEREEACHILEKRGKKSAQRHLRELGKDVKMRDLHNLVASSRQQTLFFTNIQSILDHLSETEDQTSVVEVVTKPDGKIVGIYYQDKEMIRVYASYPQYLIVDATCKFNSLKMPLYTMLVEDGNGDCEIVAIFIVFTSNLDSILSMLLRFKENNPSWSQVQVIMADKDFTERRVLEEEFPNASVQICLYHTLRAFKQELSRERMGLEKKEISHCMKLMKKLATSKTGAEYEENYTQLLNTKLKKVVEYYNNCWHSYQEEWVEGMKSRSVALKAEAPKKLESVDNFLRGVFKDSPSAALLMGNLKKASSSLRDIRDHSAAEMLAKEPVEDYKEDSILSLFEGYVTPFALKHILRQLKLSWQVNVTSNTGKSTFSIKTIKGVLNVSLTSCPCIFSQSLRLPCRHIFAVRRYNGLPLFDKDVISRRWTIGYYKSSSRVVDQNASPGTDTSSYMYSLLSRHERHAKISAITQQLADAVTDAPVERFSTHVEVFKNLLSILQKGASVKVTEETHATEGEKEDDSTAQQVNRVKVTSITLEKTRPGKKGRQAAKPDKTPPGRPSQAVASSADKPPQDKETDASEAINGHPEVEGIHIDDDTRDSSVAEEVEIVASQDVSENAEKDGISDGVDEDILCTS